MQTLVILFIGHYFEGLLRRDSNPILYNLPPITQADHCLWGHHGVQNSVSHSAGLSGWILLRPNTVSTMVPAFIISLLLFFFLLIFSKIVFIFWLVLHFWKEFSSQMYVWLALFFFLRVYSHQMCLNALANACWCIHMVKKKNM